MLLKRLRLLTLIVMAGLAGCGGESTSGNESRLDEIAFICDIGYSLCLVAGDDPRKRVITDQLDVHSFAWSPSGDTVVVASIGRRRLAGASFIGGADLFLLDIGGDVKPLPIGHANSDPSWSPDGDRIALSSDRDLMRTAQTAGAVGSIYTLSLEDDTVQRVTSGTDDREPTWSPDGERIAFLRDGEVWIVSSDGVSLEQLRISREIIPTSLSWSPDGRKIAVGNFDGGIYIVDTAQAGSLRLALDSSIVTDVDEPSWSDDGEHIAFRGIDNQGGCAAVFVTSITEGATRRLSTCRPDDLVADSPAWRPDRG